MARTVSIGSDGQDVIINIPLTVGWEHTEATLRLNQKQLLWMISELQKHVRPEKEGNADG